jgi:hypothetical protein
MKILHRYGKIAEFLVQINFKMSKHFHYAVSYIGYYISSANHGLYWLAVVYKTKKENKNVIGSCENYSKCWILTIKSIQLYL